MNLHAIFIKYLPNLLYFLYLFNQANAKYAQYQFNIPLSFDRLCPSKDFKCSDGNYHYLCPIRNLTPCDPYRPIPVRGGLQASFILGHNGIRNKVAEDWGIANMNLVHWSRELSIVAEKYLQLCAVDADNCASVGDISLVVHQNYAIRYNLAQRWPGRIVRSWYMEIDYSVQSFGDFLKYRMSHHVENFTQMVWPELEFIGCAAAKLRNRFYLIVCYYYPAIQKDKIETAFKFGEPCSKCSKTRNACSLTFLGLCGLDVDLQSSAHLQLSEIPHMILTSCLLYFANKFYFK